MSRACLRSAVALVLLLGGCGVSDTYLPKPIPMTSPESDPQGTYVPGTAVSVAAFAAEDRESVHSIFGSHGLWAMHVLVVRLDIDSADKVPTKLLLDSATVAFGGARYHAISPNEAYDIAWQSKQPMKAIESSVYNVGQLLFTAATLGIGSVVYALPSPFSQPAPNSDAFGRDLNDEALVGNITLVDGSVRSGFLFFALPQNFDMKHLENGQMELHFLQNTPVAREYSVSFLLNSK